MNGIELDSRSRQRRPLWAALAGGLIIGLAVGALAFFSSRPQKPAAPEVSVYTSGQITPFPASSTVVAIDPAAQKTQSGVEVGQPPPEFTLMALDGEEVSLADYRGQPVLINFWATWCPPCRLEMPDLVETYEAHKDEGFIILAIDLTFQDSIPDVEAFVEEFGLTFPVLLDQDGGVTNEQYRLLGLPMSVFVNREGVITRLHIGAMTGEQVDDFVNELIEG